MFPMKRLFSQTPYFLFSPVVQYLGPIAMSNPSFLQYQWNTPETVNRISAVRDKYDPIGGFDNLAYVPRGTNFLSEAVCDNNE